MTNETFHSVLVADDELPSRQYVCELIKQDPRFHISTICDSGLSTITEAKKHQFDAVFLDIQMPGMDGFEVMEAYEGSKPLVVFVTAYGEYALRAFEYEAFDYVQKPIDPARFSKVLDRVHQRLIERKTLSTSVESANTKQDYIEKSNARDLAQQGKKLLNAVRQDLIYEEKEIQVIESASNYVNVRIKDEFYLVRESLDSFCRKLSSDDFVRVHRSYVVNVQWVRKMRYGKSGSAELFLADGHVIPVSRSRRNEVAEILRRLIDASNIQEDDYII